MKIKKKIKNLKPTEINLHLKYQCPECSIDHWISLDEAKTPGFIIVCYCRTTLKVKGVKSTKIIFRNQKKIVAKKQKDTQEIPLEILDSCVKILVGYGYSESEAKLLITKSYADNSTNNPLELIKFTLTNIGGSCG
jgi:hypothetical protein